MNSKKFPFVTTSALVVLIGCVTVVHASSACYVEMGDYEWLWEKYEGNMIESYNSSLDHSFLFTICIRVDTVRGDWKNQSEPEQHGYFYGVMHSFVVGAGTTGHEISGANFTQHFHDGDRGLPCTTQSLRRQAQVDLYCDACPNGTRCEGGEESDCVCAVEQFEDCRLRYSVSIPCPPRKHKSVPPPPPAPSDPWKTIWHVLVILGSFAVICYTAGWFYNIRWRKLSGSDALPFYSWCCAKRHNRNDRLSVSGSAPTVDPSGQGAARSGGGGRVYQNI